MKKFAEIIVSITNKEVDRIFTYKIPEDFISEIKIGMRVIIPFGKGNKKIEGYIIGFTNKIDFDESKLKYILEMPDLYPMFTKEMIELGKWMQNKYYTTLAHCLKTIMPAGVSMKSEYLIEVLDAKNLTDKQNEIVNYILKNNNQVTEIELEDNFSNISATLKNLEKKGAIVKKQLSKIEDYSLKLNYAFLNEEIEIDEIIKSYKNQNSPQVRVLNLLKEKESLSVKDIKTYLNISNSPINTLEKNNFIYIEKIEVRRNISINYNEEKKYITLNKEQEKVFEFIENIIENENEIKKPILLHGVTGSGKTEIYIRAIKKIIEKNKQGIVLVPEISLTPQTVARFYNVFGDKIAVTHSRLSLGERHDQWKNARDGKINIMIGPRSAIFTPFENLGIIIIDEEHESSYISELTPKYNAKEVAIKLSELTKSILIMGSATPSVDSYYKSEIKQFDLLEMKERVNKSLPKVKIVDMREELIKGNRSIFSIELEENLKRVVENNQQAILFLNRRGSSTFISCRSCGHVLECKDCSVNYTYHSYSKKLMCHYCGKEEKVPETCPVCNSKYIKFFGAGTQKIEEETKKIFPNEKILRMDFDTVSKKNSHEKILNQFKNGDAKILIGTQMIAKGLDFPNVSLVGVITADTSLNTGDFKSGENTFQLLTQVSGRAGRGNIKGNVFIQTYNPEHYSIIYAKENNYKEFYDHEISLRRQMLYPPFSNIFTILFSCEREKELIEKIKKLSDVMEYFADKGSKKNQFDILGPSPAFISKIKNKYRWRLIVKGLDEENLKNFVFYSINKLKETENLNNISMNLTLNPIMIV